MVENAKAKHGMASTIIMMLKVLRGPNLSVRRPTTIRPGAVRATFVIKRSFNCGVVRFIDPMMVVASGAMLNQTKKVRKNANHVLWSALMSNLLRWNRVPVDICLSSSYSVDILNLRKEFYDTQ